MQDDERKDATEELPASGANALGALRKLWGATGRERAFLTGKPGAPGEMSSRSAMEETIGKIGFEGLDTFAEDNEATSNTHLAGQRLQAAWKKTLQREGKMIHPGKSVSDLIAASREGGLPAPPAEGEED